MVGGKNIKDGPLCQGQEPAKLGEPFLTSEIPPFYLLVLTP